MRLLILLLLAFPSCTTVYGPSGKKLYSSSSNNNGVKITQTAKTTSVEIAYQDNASAARVHWHGATNLASEAVTGAIGLKGGNEVIGGVASVVTPVVNRPTTRATPTPLP